MTPHMIVKEITQKGQQTKLLLMSRLPYKD
jgi:hypothetical protein